MGKKFQNKKRKFGSTKATPVRRATYKKKRFYKKKGFGASKYSRKKNFLATQKKHTNLHPNKWLGYYSRFYRQKFITFAYMTPGVDAGRYNHLVINPGVVLNGDGNFISQLGALGAYGNWRVKGISIEIINYWALATNSAFANFGGFQKIWTTWTFMNDSTLVSQNITENPNTYTAYWTSNPQFKDHSPYQKQISSYFAVSKYLKKNKSTYVVTQGGDPVFLTGDWIPSTVTPAAMAVVFPTYQFYCETFTALNATNAAMKTFKYDVKIYVEFKDNKTHSMTMPHYTSDHPLKIDVDEIVKKDNKDCVIEGMEDPYKDDSSINTKLTKMHIKKLK